MGPAAARGKCRPYSDDVVAVETIDDIFPQQRGMGNHGVALGREEHEVGLPNDGTQSLAV
jgi:hypothetical protein